MKISKYTRLGVIIVFSIAVLIWGLSYLQGEDILKKNNEYHIKYERVDGLTESNEVTLNGYKIGQVKEINFLPDHSGRLLVTLIINSSVKIPVNSLAKIVSSDIMGSRSIKLITSKEQKYYSDNDTIPGDIESDLKEQVSMQVLPLKNKAEELLGTLDSAVTVLTVIFNEDARKNLSESFKNINQSVYNIERTTADLQEIVSSKKQNMANIITNLDSITTTFNNNTDEFDATIKNLSTFSDTLAQIKLSPLLSNLLEISEQLNIVLNRFQQTDNTAGLLLNDDNLYQSIKLLTDNINLLSTDIRVNPERYLNFSAIDLGRKVYVNTTGEAKGDIIFKVHLISSETKIPLSSDIFKGFQPEEYKVSGAYTYLTGTTDSFPGILEIHKKALKKFPDATVIAFRNGKLIKLEKALKKF